MATATIKWTQTTDDGDEIEHDLPAKFEVCGSCDGHGKHVDPAVDEHGISREEFNEDPDFRDSYMSGVYDITCQECSGRRVVPVVQLDEMDPKLREEYEKSLEDEAAYEAMRRSERRYGA